MISSEGLAGEAVEVDEYQGLQLINCGPGGAIDAVAVISVQSQRTQRACLRTISPRTANRQGRPPSPQTSLDWMRPAHMREGKERDAQSINSKNLYLMSEGS